MLFKKLMLCCCVQSGRVWRSSREHQLIGDKNIPRSAAAARHQPNTK